MTDVLERERKVSDEDRQRAEIYDFLSALLASPPSKALLARYAGLQGNETPFGQATDTLATLAGKTSEPAAEREFTDLFIGLGRGELMPFASYYMTGFINEKPLAELRRDMMRLTIKRAPDVYEPEDNIASLMEMMAGLIEGRFGAAASVETQRSFFNKHIAPWASLFFSDLEKAKGSVFYAPVGTIGRLFMEIEREAFRMAGD